jgi:hypothetical protein
MSIKETWNATKALISKAVDNMSSTTVIISRDHMIYSKETGKFNKAIMKFVKELTKKTRATERFAKLKESRTTGINLEGSWATKATTIE